LVDPLRPDEEAAPRLFFAAEPDFFDAVFTLPLAAPFAPDRVFEAELVAFEELLVPPRDALRALAFEVPLAVLPAFVPADRPAPPFAADERFDAVEAVRFVPTAAERFFAAPVEARPAEPRLALDDVRRADVPFVAAPRFEPREPDAASRATNLKKRLVCPEPISS